MNSQFLAILASARSNPVICNLGKFECIEFEDKSAELDVDLSVFSVRWNFSIPSSISLEIVDIYVGRLARAAKDSGYVILHEELRTNLKGTVRDSYRGVMHFSKHFPHWY